MSDDTTVAPQYTIPTALAPRWPVYLGISSISGASALYSLVAAAFSINATVIYLSIFTSAVCFSLALTFAFHRRNSYAFAASLATVPVFFGLAFFTQAADPLLTKAAHKTNAVQRFFVDIIHDPQPSLDKAVREGAIRRATATDVNAFRDAYLEKKYTSRGVPVPANDNALSVSDVDLDRAYVVLAPFTYPPGLVDEYRAVFFVPAGVAEPTGDIGHSALYDFASLTVVCTAARTFTGPGPGGGIISC